MSTPAPKRFDLYQLAGPVPMPGDQPAARVCAVLPYAAIPPGSPVPAGWQVVRLHQNYRADRIRLLALLDWMIGLKVDAISLSTGFHADHDPSDPLHVATRTAADRGISVVVAAGNDGPAQGSLQELALDPWVIPVGSTDAEGKLLRSSSRGSPSAPGPAVVADGTPPGLRYKMIVDFTGGGEPDVREYPPDHPGTSFAAPRVANLIVWVRKTLETCQAMYDAWRGGERLAVVKLPTIGAPAALDPDFMGGGPGELRRRLDLAGQDEVRFPVRQDGRDWFATVMASLGEAAGPPVANAEVARRVLLAAAVPVPGEPWETGAGLVSVKTVRDYLAQFTIKRWVQVFHPDAVIDPAAARWLDTEQAPFWSSTDLDMLHDIFATGVNLAVEKVRQPRPEAGE